MSSPTDEIRRPPTPDRKRSLEPESASDEEERTGRSTKRVHRGGSRSPSQYEGSPTSEHERQERSPAPKEEDDLSFSIDRRGSFESVDHGSQIDQPADNNTNNQPVADEAQQFQAPETQPPVEDDEDEGFVPRIMSMRIVVTTKEAGIIIGKQGKNVADIRSNSGAKVMISEHQPGATDRIVTVTGMLDVVAKGFSLIARTIVEEHPSEIEVTARHMTIRLLVPHVRMGSVIGKHGSKIKEVQDASGARIVATEEMMPGSTERTVSISGVIDSIHIATYHIGAVLQQHPERAMGNIPYLPQPIGVVVRPPYAPPSAMPYPPPPGTAPPPPWPLPNNQMGVGPNSVQIQQIFIPNDLVGAIIGKSGSKINEIRHMSGCQIKIGDAQYGQKDRLVTITGTPDAGQMAVYMIYSRLEVEKQRHQVPPPR
ncbi:hypothetical protein HK097_002647 [Rhizophlyctis rosea]|uniref:K Homology domain-containing protein n=1 Tax=Rhizophlyctis rosea TaxID=64517 RepID=A0AAD5WXN5_9FUNG|nr:hypothetical protein HK097_002647 [Rhizophlyctis rosea]